MNILTDIMSSSLTKIQEERLRKKQKEIAKRIILEDDFPKPIKTIAGFDLAFKDDTAFVAGILLDYENLYTREIKIIKTKLSFPYIPTFLTFREGPPIIKLYKKLKTKPDIIMINGQGIAHPLYCGIASHVGVLLDTPSIGVAQNRLCGEYKEPKDVGDHSPLMYEGKTIGYVYKSKKNCRPIFISPGHRISLKSSLEIVKNCIRDLKLPVPVHLAHIHANKMKKISHHNIEK